MKRIGYLFRVLRGASFKKLTTVINRIHHQTKKSRLYLFVDIFVCALKYGAGYNDYLIFAFYDMTPQQRKTYVTRLINKKMITMLNDPSRECWFDRKSRFDQRFSEFLGREFYLMENADETSFAAFIKDKERVFAKPDVGECGKGIECLYPSAYDDVTTLYLYLRQRKFAVIEEAIVQHEALSALYPFSVNSLRVVTLVAQGEPHCIYAVLKTGNGNHFVDNLESGGICAPIDLENECVSGVGHTAALTNFAEHPYSGIPFIGYRIPFVKEAVAMCQRAALKIPEIKYVGWDVAITQSGPAIIEGNCHPGYDFWQLPEHTPDKKGLLPKYKTLLHI